MRTARETNKLFKKLEKDLHKDFIEDGQKRTHYSIQMSIKAFRKNFLKDGEENTLSYEELYESLIGYC